MKLNEKIRKLIDFRGAVPAVLTPFDSDGALNLSVIQGYVKYLTNHQVNGVYIIGTTGEGYSMTNDEKIALAKKWMEEINAQKADLLSIVNVTSTCIPEMTKLAAVCDKLGVDAIAVLPPAYYKATTVKQMIDYLKLVAQHAPNTPLLYYQIPMFTGELPFELVDLIGAALDQIPQFAAMKFTDANCIRLAQIQRKFGNRFKVFSGFEEALSANILACGITASVGALFSLPDTVRSFHLMLEAAEKNDIATVRKEQDKLAEEIDKHKSTGNFFLSLKSTVNQNVKSLGLDFGQPRPPVHYP